MTQEDYTAICKRFVDELFNRGNLDFIDELVDASFMVNKHEMGREGLKEAVLWWRTAFPDIRLTIEELLIDGDRAGIWYSARGTHNGEFIGIPPTGKRINWVGFDFLRFSDGKIVEGLFIADRLSIVHQLGGAVEKH